MNETISFIGTARRIGFLLVGSISLWLMLFSVTFAESIRSFDSNIVINTDSSLTVTETIRYDFGDEFRHGIYRDLSAQHAQAASAWYKEKYVDYTLLNVFRNGFPEQYVIESSDGLSVKIGAPSKQITGLQEYKISYKVIGAITEGIDGTELYWNVTGSDWDVSMQNITASVTAGGAQFEVAQHCYAGRIGSSESCTRVNVSVQEVIFFQSRLQPQEGLTIAQAISLPVAATAIERFNLQLLDLVLTLIALIAAAVFAYRWYVRRKMGKTIIAQYEPLADFKPMFTGVLIDNRLDSRDITAGIVYLAQQGFISIRHIESKILHFFDHSDYEVTLLRSPAEAETVFQKDILSLFFNNYKIGQQLMLSSLRTDISKRKENGKILKKLRLEVVKDLEKLGFIEETKMNIVKKTSMFLLLYVALAALSNLNLIVSVSLFILVLFLHALWSTKRTEKGHEAVRYLEGFKDFLTVTDADRFAFHNAPGLSPQQFMEYLPYAIAFGVEKKWAEVFKNIHIDTPDWYISNNQSSFGSLALTQNLGAFSQSFLGSTGTRGSSGGGSSGGGSGGGGGGSW